MRINKDEEKGSFKDSNLYTVLIAVILLAFTLLIGFSIKRILFNDNISNQKEINVDEVKGFGKTPQEALAKFIYLSGNIGDKKEVNIANLENGSLRKNNANRRIKAYEESVKGVSNDSPILTYDFMNQVNNGLLQDRWADFYSVDKKSIKVSDASEPYEVTSQSNSDKKYKAVDLTATYNSNKSLYRLKAQDSSSDGTYVRVDNEKIIKDVKFVMVEVDKESWKVYDVVDDDHQIKDRWALWDGYAERDKDYTEDKIVEEIKGGNK